MFAGYILLLLIFIGVMYAIWKFVIEPRLPDEPQIPEHAEILINKLFEVQEMREELIAAKKERDITEEMKDLDSKIASLEKEIEKIENA
jgi:uncharacterized membrane protein YgaE (UPF0421/DUF939 family)